MTANIGYATLSIIPSLDGAGNEVRRIGQRMSDDLSRHLRGAGDGFSTGLQGAWRDSSGRLRNALGQFVSEARAAGSDAGDGFTSGMGSEIDSSAGGGGGLMGAIGGLGTALVAGVAAIGLAAGAALTKGMTDAIDAEAANDKLAAQMGIFDPARAKELGGVASNLYAGAWGENLGEVNDAIREVFSNGLVPEDVTNAQLEDLTAKVLDFSTVAGADVNMTGQAIGNMLRNGLAPNAEAALDILTRGFQQGADKSGDLLETFQEYSTQFRQLGIDGATSTGLLSQALKAGARDADTAADALKEFAIRGQDMSATSVHAYQELGFNAQEMSEAVAKGGPEAAGALDQVLDKLRVMEPGAYRTGLAVELFGTKAEDMQEALYAMDPTTAVQGLGDIAGAAERTGDVLNDNAASKIESFKRTALQGLSNFVAENVLPAFTGILDVVGPFFGDLSKAFGEDGLDGLVDKFSAMWPGIQAGITTFLREQGPKLWTGLLDGLQGLMELGARLQSSLLTALGEMLPKIGDWFVTVAWPYIKTNWQGWIDGFLGWFVPMQVQMGEALGGFLGAIGEWLVTTGIPFAVEAGADMWRGFLRWMFETVIPSVLAWGGDLLASFGAWITGTAVPALWEKGKELFAQLVTWLTTDGKDLALEKLGEFLGAITNWLKNDAPGLISSAASGMWDGIKSGLRTALNWAIDKWNGLQFEVPTSPFSSQTVGTPQIPRIPEFHQGGIVPGRAGEEVLILAQAGERVLTRSQQARDGSGQPPMVHATVMLGEDVLVETVTRGQYRRSRRRSAAA